MRCRHCSLRQVCGYLRGVLHGRDDFHTANVVRHLHATALKRRNHGRRPLALLLLGLQLVEDCGELALGAVCQLLDRLLVVREVGQRDHAVEGHVVACVVHDHAGLAYALDLLHLDAGHVAHVLVVAEHHELLNEAGLLHVLVLLLGVGAHDGLDDRLHGILVVDDCGAFPRAQLAHRHDARVPRLDAVDAAVLHDRDGLVGYALHAHALGELANVLLVRLRRVVAGCVLVAELVLQGEDIGEFHGYYSLHFMPPIWVFVLFGIDLTFFSILSLRFWAALISRSMLRMSASSTAISHCSRAFIRW